MSNTTAHPNFVWHFSALHINKVDKKGNSQEQIREGSADAPATVAILLES